jgi:hypothetical protein
MGHVATSAPKPLSLRLARARTLLATATRLPVRVRGPGSYPGMLQQALRRLHCQIDCRNRLRAGAAHTTREAQQPAPLANPLGAL